MAPFGFGIAKVALFSVFAKKSEKFYCKFLISLRQI
jgi:hypothetical protein